VTAHQVSGPGSVPLHADGSVDLRETRAAAAFTAAPRDGSSRGTVAVLHAWWGVTGSVIDRCRDLARLGYLAVAPDLYRGKTAASAKDAQLSLIFNLRVVCCPA
jgi:dienelactone hydrolase